MKKNNEMLSSLKWIFYVSRRFSRVDRKGRSKVTSFLASLGICFGVMTLITVISIMNGFQMSFIDSIMEVSSYHIRVSGINAGSAEDFELYCKDNPYIKNTFAFYEAQSLMVGRNGKQSPALIRAVSDALLENDEGFKNEAKIWAGSGQLDSEEDILLGTELARKLSARSGGMVNLFALSGSNDVSLLSQDRQFKVKGLFRTGYADINASYAFISLKAGQKYFGKDAPLMYGIKLFNTEDDGKVIALLQKDFPSLSFESWKSYNRSFFGTLKIEKNMLMLLVFIIFIVVAVNIFNGMRRMVYEKREEISVLSALGARRDSIQFIFVMQGFLTGVRGAVPGLAAGLLLSVKMSGIFMIMSKIVYYFQVLFTSLVNPSAVSYVRENPMYLVYANIPPRIILSEVFMITVFGMFSALLASWSASRGVLKLTVAEVMRDE